jgi:hypothetical protein
VHKIRNFHEGHSTVGEWQGSGTVVVGSWPGRGRVAAWERHGNGMGTAWERHGMCESAFIDFSHGTIDAITPLCREYVHYHQDFTRRFV